MLKQEEYGISKVMIGLAVWVTLVIQYVMVLLSRFSHPGKVCCGDYSVYLESPSIYEQYYLRQQGKFLYYFAIISIVIVSVATCCIGTCGTCFVLGESTAAFNNIEDFFKNMDSFSEMMRKGFEEPQAQP